ncbi:hypothetical protein HELRODRAFT_73057 [Helobdella robusta]|uniref:Ubiquitin carboxyl-terminal hydrolase n=1 Tax=Helobdella robusta TaxID=6412 RepID=T1G193_HELRO|nr:hypothetical protein HELRODRAFT_73057 [Helobdella robusta]ESO09981.1 hypothetical protein HELRODRAFT_73057 [Helobdella robusta]
MHETSHKSNTEIENKCDENNSLDSGHESNVTGLKKPKTPDNHLPVSSNAEEIPAQLNSEPEPAEQPTKQPSSLPPQLAPFTNSTTDDLQGATGVGPDNNGEGRESIYNVKWIRFNQVSLPIVTQNENGPCPLLAIMNYLFLQQRVQLETRSNIIPSSQLISLLADYIFEHVPNRIQPNTRLNYEQKMHDAIAMFPNLQTGLDVNVRFTGVSHFEYTPSSEIFDLLDIPLYHGWLVDPESEEVLEAVSNATYNQLVEMVINQKCSSQFDLAEKALIAEEFLNATASQLTYHGLCELASALRDSDMGVLFRNNHFHTLLKHDGALYVLATDQGFLNEPRVVWETLTNVEGDSHFCDANFRIFQSPSETKNPDQIDQDYFVALSMEQEQEENSQSVSNWTDLGLTDEELAMRLQEEENSLASQADNRQQHSAGATGSSRDQGTTRNISKVTTDAKPKKDSLVSRNFLINFKIKLRQRKMFRKVIFEIPSAQKIFHLFLILFQI